MTGACDEFYEPRGLWSCVLGPFMGSCTVRERELLSSRWFQTQCIEYSGSTEDFVRTLCSLLGSIPSLAQTRFSAERCPKDAVIGRCLEDGDESQVRFYYRGDASDLRRECEETLGGVWRF